MKAIAIVPGTQDVKIIDRPEPRLAAPDEVKVKVLEVGICGTDREEASGGRAMPPNGKPELVLGHEMFGRVMEVGNAVSRVKPGDFAVFTVRRPCGKCIPCGMNRPDMCQTGDYLERGIWGLDGFQAECVIDREAFIVRVPPELKNIGVLCEPLSVVEKAIDETVRVQFARLPDAPATPDWLYGKRCLVAGLGPIGLLAAMVFVLRGAQVFGLDIVDEGTVRPKWLEAIGGTYMDGRQVPPDSVDEKIGPMDIILEATGVASLEFNLLDALAFNGAYVLTGIPGGNRPLTIQGAELIRQLVLDNQVMLGSVNASRDHFQMGIDDLAQADLRWDGALEQLITHRYPYIEAQTAFRQHSSDEIKAVITWPDGN